MPSISDRFDAVLMLTWSDWFSEPRSNRYYYATRFAKSLPVLFFQHKYQKSESLHIENSGVDNIDIVTISAPVSSEEVSELKKLLYARGIKRPLIWIYDSMNYQLVIDALPGAFLVYHATEDYLTPTSGWNQSVSILAAPLRKLLRRVDFVVACTRGVGRSYQTTGGYSGPLAVIENGCDIDHISQVIASLSQKPGVTRPIAIFQGGINQRVDYSLLFDVICRLPEWEFRFCGAAQPSDGWQKILKLPNVNYLGELPFDRVVEQMHSSDVGIIPYIQDEWIRNSFPLKAYEYVACGLPVVSVPIDCLQRDPRLFSLEVSGADFAKAITESAATRHDVGLLHERSVAAASNSYDSRFRDMEARLLDAASNSSRSLPRFRIAVLYDSMISMHVSTIAEHVESFGKYSRHDITYVPASTDYWKISAAKVEAMVDFSTFDIVILHYSIRLSVRHHLDEGIARALDKFNGVKALFIQDEYEGTEIARNWMDRLRFDVVYTCVPREEVEKVYPSYRYPGTDFLQTLTGYVPEHPALLTMGRPLSERKVVVAYRGRKLHPVYGALGLDKYRIGVEMKIIATMRGIPVDIEVDDAKRIYGDAWYEFLGGARATLGTESGANIFDADGSLRRRIDTLKKSNPEISFQELSESVLAGREGEVHMNQISPKIFEAIKLRTALVLFEGDYSGVVLAGRHYVPLKKDFSNVDDVLAKLGDDSYLSEITERAYTEVVESQKYSYRNFMLAVEADLDARMYRAKESQELLIARYVVDANGVLAPVLPLLPAGLQVGPHPLGEPIMLSSLSPVSERSLRHLARKVVLLCLRSLPVRLRTKCIVELVALEQRSRKVGLALTKKIWRRLPSSLQDWLRLKVAGRFH